MPQNSSKLLGTQGEEEALIFLRKRGYDLLARNWRHKKLEVDLIMRKGELIVFIEVKTRKSSTFGDPEVFVTRKKQSFLITAANQYLIENNLDIACRFDVIAVVKGEGAYTIKHLEGAFYPTIK